MQWSALENFKLADLHSLAVSIKSNRQHRLARGERRSWLGEIPPRSSPGKTIEATWDSGKESSWALVMEALTSFDGWGSCENGLLISSFCGPGCQEHPPGEFMATLFLNFPNMYFSTSN